MAITNWPPRCWSIQYPAYLVGHALTSALSTDTACCWTSSRRSASAVEMPCAWTRYATEFWTLDGSMVNRGDGELGFEPAIAIPPPRTSAGKQVIAAHSAQNRGLYLITPVHPSFGPARRRVTAA